MISHVRYEGDPHSYTKYKHSDNKYYVKCESRKVIAGVPYVCKYKHKREDRHKALLAQKKVHTCQYYNHQICFNRWPNWADNWRYNWWIRWSPKHRRRRRGGGGAGEEETSDSREQRIREEEERQLAKNKSYLQKSKDWVKQYFINTGLSAKSTSTLLKYFNTYVEAKDAFPDCHCFTEIGISWIQLEDSERPYAPLAKLAQRLHASPCSEAACERTNSKQRLIYTARRKRSNRDLLDARLTILNATFNGNEKSDYLKQKIIRKQAKVHQLQLDADEEEEKQEKEEKEDE